MKPIYMAGPWITDHEKLAVNDAMSDWFNVPYKYVEKFQNEFAKYHGRKFGIMTPNCTTSIHLLLTALGVTEGDEVIVPECTWIATAAPITYLKATPVFCDIDPINWCLDPEAVKKNITSKTKAIIVVDLFGNMPNMDALSAISEKYNIPLVEDAAEALGSTYKSIKAGKFGIGSVFSFHRTKTITTGEGGMLLLDDENLYKRCMILRDHGRDTALPKEMRNPNEKEYFNSEITYKYMPFNIQAALGYAQFERMDELVNKKHWIYEAFKKGLSDIDDIQLNAEPEYVFNGIWITGLVFGKTHNMTKETAIQKLAELGVPSRPFFYPLSSLPAYGLTEKYKDKNPVAYDISSRGINLPCSLDLEQDQIDFICKGIHQIL